MIKSQNKSVAVESVEILSKKQLKFHHKQQQLD
jgi:hypothetical protein